jgi:hypothetical protein
MESSSATSPEQQLAGGPHTVWEAPVRPLRASGRPTGTGEDVRLGLALGGRGGRRLGGGCLLVHPELMDMQPRDLEILDLEAADHRASDRQPANCQGADGPGANSRRPDRGRADADRCQEHRRRLLAAATTKLHRTVRASSAIHAIVLQWSKVGVGFLALPPARPHFGVVIPMTYTLGPDSSTRPRTVKITIYGWSSRVIQRWPRWRMASVQVRRHYGSSGC